MSTITSNKNLQNRKARYNYEITETYEAGIVLVGNEVKSIRAGKINFADAYITIKGNAAYLHNMHIEPYENASHFPPEPMRIRKLLLHKEEINRLMGKTAEKGLTMVPTKLYFTRNILKVQIGLGKGKNKGDKREVLKRRAQDKEINRVIKAHM
jgi:SsrA-binding protein